MNHQKLIIIGSGPAGHTAAIYAARANLAPLLFEGFFSGISGGQLMTTTEVENFPGFPEGITGPALMDLIKKQAGRFGTTFLQKDVTAVDFSIRPFKIFSKNEEFTADAVIIATGAAAKKIDIPGAGEDGFWQKGVTACAVCDGANPMFRNKPLFVIGGGDSAAEEAMFLTKYASTVFVVHRRDSLRASKIMADRLVAHPKVKMLWNSAITAIHGDKVVRSVTVKNLLNNVEKEEESAGVFFAIGHKPNTDFLNNQLELNPQGYIQVTDGTKTSIEGVFAAGDVYDHRYRQAISAAGSGCMAALDAEKWLQENSL
ncbi:thioredoxin-disulfide reductase [Candidatus Clavichlamydia salmonicola]|uniref:thioredoxin-disulfide reductase n=1 Tax=Candidatus Clavichlamydia salmonicola TaxID=469812 RepID=UPI0018910B2E|nr:thioredoxin-disulfide reductase [Candidatus Clavichlamydia salmonicola]